MLGKFFSTFTTATEIGVAVRYATSCVGTVLAMLVFMNWLDQPTADALSQSIPAFIGALGAVIATLIPIYAMMTKAHSDKAAEAAKRIDAEVPAGDTVMIKTPAGQRDIIIPPLNPG